jgi:hypothetical protein
MPSLQDIMGMYQSFDPYGSFKEGQRAPAEQQLQDIAVQEQLKDAQAQQTPSLGQIAGAPQAGMQAGTSPLAMGAKSIFGTDKVKLVNDNGQETIAGKINTEYQQAAKDNQIASSLDSDAMKIKKIATTERDGTKRAEMLNKASEIALRAQSIREKNQKLQDNYKKEFQDTQSQGLLNMVNAKNQTQIDQARKDYEAKTGLPVPEFLPTKYDPDSMKAALNNPAIPKEVADAVKKDLREQQTAEDLHKERTINIQKKQAAERDNIIYNAAQGLDLSNQKQVQNFAALVNKKARTEKDVATTGEIKTVMNQIAPEYRGDLNTSTGIKDVNAKLDTARQAYKISDFVTTNQISTGKFGELYKTLDAFDTSPASLDKVNKVVANQELSKMILDYANAYSRSATGRGVATIAELKAALKTFSEAGMSGTSSANVFKFMGNKTEQEIADKYFGGDINAIKLKHSKVESVTAPKADVDTSNPLLQ